MTTKKTSNKPDEPSSENRAPTSPRSDFIYAAGIVLGLSYPILAFSTGGRAVYQLLFKADIENYLASALSATAATCYLLATIGFFKRRKWAWWLSVGVLAFETTLTFLVGSLSFIIPEVIGRTVWRHFGIDYGFFPLFQPLVGLFWLFSPEILEVYGITLPWSKVKQG